MQIIDIPIGAIKVPDRLRSLDPNRVQQLKSSIDQLGLINPINVFKGGGDTFVLAAGAHRFQAVKELGHATILAKMMDGSDLDRQLVEIDENLCRSELTPAERALHECRRKAIWEAMHAVQQRRTSVDVASTADSGELGGKSLPTQPGDMETQIVSAAPERDARGQRKSPQQQRGFAAVTAALTGESKKTVNNNVRRGNVLGERLLPAIVGTSLDKVVELDALASLPPEDRADLVDRAKAGEKVSARNVQETDRETPAARNRVLAGRAVAAMEKCTRMMDESEFAAALRGAMVSERVVAFAEILGTTR